MKPDNKKITIHSQQQQAKGKKLKQFYETQISWFHVNGFSYFLLAFRTWRFTRESKWIFYDLICFSYFVFSCLESQISFAAVNMHVVEKEWNNFN